MKSLITAAIIMTFAGTAIADNDYVHLSFQDYEHYDNNQPAVGSADIDYVHLSFQDNESLSNERTGGQTEVGYSEIDHLEIGDSEIDQLLQLYQDSY